MLLNEYINNFKKWLVELTIKNKMIKNGEKSETPNRKKQFIYWTTLGVGVGSEFSFNHFGLVLKEYDKVALVVPITTKDTNEKLVELDIIKEIDPCKKSYAVLSQIKTLSKTRLSTYKSKETKEFVNIKLDDDKMKLVVEEFLKIGTGI